MSAGGEGRTGRATRLAIELLVVLVAAGIAAVVVQRAVLAVFYIPSASMEPQLEINDRVAVSKLAYDLHSPRRGDVVVFLARAEGSQAAGSAPTATHQRDLIKRVVGLPGETVTGRSGHVWIDNRLLVEPYLPPGTLTSDFGPVRVPPGDLWVMGDNRSDSTDSRVFGPISQGSVVGRALWRVWPLDRLAFL
ncbi:MAG: signal peptidase I [Acidimicrobiales bacterium]